MKGLPGDILQEIRATLLSCGPFDDPGAIANLFLDERLSIWIYSIPSGSYPQARVNALITFLYNKQFDQPNPLLRFMAVLAESLPPEDGCRQQIVNTGIKLADFLEVDRSVITGEAVTEPSPAPEPAPRPETLVSPPTGRLTGDNAQEFRDALVSAFPTPNKLQQMLDFRLGKNLYEITTSSGLGNLAYDVIVEARSAGWALDLLAAARQANPGNPELLAFAQQFGLAATNIGTFELERLLKDADAAVNVAVWRQRLGEIEAQVCRIETETTGAEPRPIATGFLIGPDLVMTNYHVADVFRKRKGNEIVCHFDYKVAAAGQAVREGTRVSLVEENWLVVESPQSDWEREGVGTEEPEADQLDFAILRLAEPIGNRPVGNEESAPVRGWVKAPTTIYTFPTSSILLIMQHPQHLPLKMALGDVTGWNGNSTRIRYKVNTEKGSSGSPCFNMNLEWVALHHGSDPEYSAERGNNQGIPISAIRTLLSQWGQEALLAG